MSPETKRKKTKINAASKSELRQACISLAAERDALRTAQGGLVRLIAALVRKCDRGALDGPDRLLLSATTDVPPVASDGMPDAMRVDVREIEGGRRIVVTRVEPGEAASS